MKFSAHTLKWILRIYPPLFFQRIWVRSIHSDFTQIDLTVSKSVLNKNSNGSIFGGTIFAATDPFYPIMFGQIFRHKGYQIIAWLKSSSIRFLKPSYTSLSVTFSIPSSTIEEAQTALRIHGKFVKRFEVCLTDKNGEICAIAEHEVYIRDRNYTNVFSS